MLRPERMSAPGVRGHVISPRGGRHVIPLGVTLLRVRVAGLVASSGVVVCEPDLIVSAGVS